MTFDLAALTALHNCFPQRARWRLTPTGIAIGAGAAFGTLGEPLTVRRVWTWFAVPIRASAQLYGVPVELIVAAICSESAGGVTDLNAVTSSRREESGYESDDATPDRVSVGVMQTLLSTASDMLGRAVSAVELCDPTFSIDVGARVIAQDAADSGLDAPLVAAAYNAGGLYLETTTANRWGLRCYPIGTGRYIDTFVAWFNDAMRVGSDPAFAAGAPSFAASLTPAA